MRHFDMPIILLHVFKSLQVQRQDEWQLLDSHALLSFLVAATVVAFELVIATESLCVAECLETVSYARVLTYIHLKNMNDLLVREIL